MFAINKVFPMKFESNANWSLFALHHHKNALKGVLFLFTSWQYTRVCNVTHIPNSVILAFALYHFFALCSSNLQTVDSFSHLTLPLEFERQAHFQCLCILRFVNVKCRCNLFLTKQTLHMSFKRNPLDSAKRKLEGNWFFTFFSK